MLIRTPKTWSLPEQSATPEAAFHNRRTFLRRAGYGGIAAVAGAGRLPAATAGFPSNLNPQYAGKGLEKTPQELVTSYNNFYEFSYDKREVRDLANRGWETEPWTLEIGGDVRRPLKIDINELIGKVGGIEQRVYRFRCVEAWSMVVPWDGFPLHRLIDLVEPTSSARFVRFTSFYDPDAAPGQRGGGSIDWPYVEGLRLDEARNELTLLATGVYGKPMPNQNGAPVRLIVPWKYGFKSIKSIVRIDFVKQQPRNTWNLSAPGEYGFYANVNPRVDHPRWSQATERVIGGGFFSGRQDTLLFNGYFPEVAGLYQGMDLEKHF